MKSDLNRLRETFERMDLDNFNTNLPLNWGYYFINSSKTDLENLYYQIQDNYNIISLTKINSTEWRLYISKVEVLSPETLHKRNLEFNELASKWGIVLYDGWDVEKL